MPLHKFSILLGGLALVLAMLACSTISPALPTVATFPPVSTAPAVLDTATTIPATTPPPAADTSAPNPPTSSPSPATSTPTVPSFPVLTSPSIQYLDMLDADDGWALTDAAVLRTMDGGITWYNTTPWQLGGSGVPSSSFFLDTNTGWVAVSGSDPTNGTLYHTSDGGTTWSSVATSFGGGSLHFVDSLLGWELIGLNAGMSHESVAIFRSEDGGQTWSRVFINEPGAPGSTDSLPLVGDKNGITALDANRAWVTGTQPSDDFIYVYATQDGGTTWTHQNLSVPPGYSPSQTGANLPAFFGSSQGVLPVLLFSNSNGTDFYNSQDGGQTWTATTPVPQGGFLAVGSASDFFVWDGGTPLNVSHDAGASWSSLTPNINIKDNMISLQFVNATTGWVLTGDASGNTSLYRTTDGGLTWNNLNP